MDTVTIVLVGWAAVTALGAGVWVAAGRASRCARMRSVEPDDREAQRH